MIIAYHFSKKGDIKKVNINAGDPLPTNVIWIDLIEPSLKEEKFIEQVLKVEAPTQEEMDKFEVISPFYKEGNAHYMTVTLHDKMSKEFPDSIAVTFIITDGCLVSIRYDKPKSFDYFSFWVMRNYKNSTAPDNVLTGIADFIMNCTADILEEVGNDIDKLLKLVFEKPIEKDKLSAKRYNEIIRQIGYTGNIISKNRESLVSINRMIMYFSQIEDAKYMNKRDIRLRIRHLSREISSLSEYANFLSQRNSFILDATLGMISVEQNLIIKVFTVAAAVFMPPTLIASIYGMNFDYMPELKLIFGYPLALLLIVISALLPYYYFKRKGWL